MSLSILHCYWRIETDNPVLRPAGLRDRIMAQLIDGILLGMLTGILLAIYSRGQLFSLWISPMVPLYLLQVAEGYSAQVSNGWWGGYFIEVTLPWIADFNVAYPAPLQWILYALYYTGFHAGLGQTPGKMVKGLVVLGQAGQFLSVKTALFRWAAYLISLIPLGCGFWAARWNRDAAGWHDRLTGSGVYRFTEDPS